MCLGSLGLTSLSFIGCSPVPVALPPGTFNVSTINNPKSSKRYKSSYSTPVGKYKINEQNYQGEPRKYHYYLPKNREIKSVLLLLHGSGRDGAAMIDHWHALSDRHGIALIAPDSQNPRNWSFASDGFDMMQMMIESFLDERKITDVPIYGFGHSAGAVMLTHISVRHGHYFKSIGAHAGYPQSVDLQRYAKHRKPRPPLIHILGEKDHIFSVEGAQAAGETLSAYGQDVNLVIIKKHNHWYYDLAPFINKKAWMMMTAAG